MYHRCLPLLVTEARFDVGKLLQNFSAAKDDNDGALDASAGLQTVWQLHVLRLLKESDQFFWSKTGAVFPVIV
jgi:nucleolar pre-ribosomal-associated protein 1